MRLAAGIGRIVRGDATRLSDILSAELRGQVAPVLAVCVVIGAGPAGVTVAAGVTLSVSPTGGGGRV